jgi:hypothetical protein
VRVVDDAKPELSSVVIGAGAGVTAGHVKRPEATESVTFPIASLGTPLTADVCRGICGDAGAEISAWHVVSFVQVASTSGENMFEGPEGGLVPLPFVAVTVQVYVLPLVRPDTVRGAWAPVAERVVPPLADVQVTVYPVIASDPSSIGRSNDTNADSAPGIAVPILGADGTVGGRYTATVNVVCTDGGLSSALVAEQVTVVIPIGNTEPDAWSQTTGTGPLLSLAVGTVNETATGPGAKAAGGSTPSVITSVEPVVICAVQLPVLSEKLLSFGLKKRLPSEGAVNELLDPTKNTVLPTRPISDQHGALGRIKPEVLHEAPLGDSIPPFATFGLPMSIVPDALIETGSPVVSATPVSVHAGWPGTETVTIAAPAGF